MFNRDWRIQRQSELEIASPQQGQHHHQMCARPFELRLQLSYAVGRELGFKDTLQA